MAWYNDSKGTNVGATLAALQGMALGMFGKVVLIAGGLGKDADFTPLRQTVLEKARAVVLMGRDAPLIEAALNGAVPVAQAGGYSASAPVAPGGIRFRSAVPVGDQQPNDAPCGRLGIAFNRAEVLQSSYLTRISAGAEAQCRNHGSRQGIYSRVVFLSCTPGAAQGPIRHRVNIEVHCAP